MADKQSKEMASYENPGDPKVIPPAQTAGAKRPVQKKVQKKRDFVSRKMR